MTPTLRPLLAVTLLAMTTSCLEPAKLQPESDLTVLSAGRLQASESAPALPIFVLRLARDELALSTADRAGVAMIVEDAEFQARTLDRARAAFFEILARSVERGSVDENAVAIYTEQMAWAAGMVGPYFAYGLNQLFDVLTPDQRVTLGVLAKQHYPVWAQAWTVTDRAPPRWLDGFPRRDFAELETTLVSTARTWADRSAANVRARLPRLDAGQRVALARSLRAGVLE